MGEMVDQRDKAIGNRAAERAEHQALHHEGQTDEAVGRADHAHDGDLLAPRERGELDRVRHDEERHDDERDDQNDGDDAHDVSERDELLGVIQMRAHIRDAVDAFQIRLGLLHEGEVRQAQHIAMAEDGGVDVLKEVGVIVRLEGGHGLLARDEFAGFDVRNLGDLALERAGLVLIERLVHIGDDAVLALHLGNHVVDIQREQREAAHDEQARRDDRDACKGHEPVRKDVFDALPEQEEKSTHSHSRNTHPFRR